MGDLPKQELQAQKSVKLDDETDVRYWTKLIGCSRLELVGAVRSVGAGADDVRRYLLSRRRRSA